jgi:hypothetical protein
MLPVAVAQDDPARRGSGLMQLARTTRLTTIVNSKIIS